MLAALGPRGMLANTLTACWLMASAFVVGYSVGGMFPSYLQKDLGLPTGSVALPIMLQSLMFFLSAVLWSWFSDRFGRRLTLIITCLITIPIAPLYLLTTNYSMIVVFFALQGFFGGGGMHTQWPHYLAERFPTEVRATATGFCYHQGAIFGGLVGTNAAVSAGQDGSDPDGRCASANDGRPHCYPVALHRARAGSGASVTEAQDQLTRPTAAQDHNRRYSDSIMTVHSVVPTLRYHTSEKPTV
jgi:hypothetical protein